MNTHFSYGFENQMPAGVALFLGVCFFFATLWFGLVVENQMEQHISQPSMTQTFTSDFLLAA